MGKLIFENKKFKFLFTVATSNQDALLAKAAGFIWDDQNWVTRKAVKAVKLRRFADAACEKIFKKTFITEFKAPEQIIYPDHLAPKSFQIESAMHALTRSPAYVADEAGLGKSITSILCINTLPGKTLIICPPFLKYNWLNEIMKWRAKRFSTTVIDDGHTPVSLLRNDIIIYPDSLLTNNQLRASILTMQFKWLIVDEAHRYKEATTKRTLALTGDDTHGGFARNAERVVLLSGTPIPNGRPIELYPLLSKLAPSSIGFRSKLDYGKTFCGGRQVARKEGNQTILNWDFSGATNLGFLRKGLRSKLMIRHLKKNVLKELGPKTRQIIFLDTPKEIYEYERGNLRNITMEQLLGDEEGLGSISMYRREVGEAKVIPAFNIIWEHLESTAGKVVVFAHHVSVVETLTRMLEPFGAISIRGGMTALAKQNAVTAFQTLKHHRVLVGNIDSCGVGVTLTKAPTVFFVEYSWVSGANEQAEDRVHRMTQKQNVYIKYLVLRGSLDERVLTAVLNKTNAINQVMD